MLVCAACAVLTACVRDCLADALLDILRSNHDCQCVEDDTGAMFYSLKYATKLQHLIECMANLMVHAVEVRLKREREADAAAAAAATAAGVPATAAPPAWTTGAADQGPTVASAAAITLVARGAGRCMSAARALTGQAEILDTMGCLYIIRGSRVYTSHTFITLFLKQTLAILNADEHVVPVLRVGANQFIGATQYMDYLFRPESLAALSYWEFVRWYERVALVKPKARGVEDAEADDDDAAGDDTAAANDTAGMYGSMRGGSRILSRD